MSVNNVTKIITYLELICKTELVVDGKAYNTRPRSSLLLSPMFFHKDSCIGCGRCCCSVPEKIILTESEYQYLLNFSDDDFADYGLNVEHLHEFKSNMIPEVHDVNGNKVTVYKHNAHTQTLYVETKGKEVVTCPHLFRNEDGMYRCRIHPVRSITCRMPHLKIMYNHGGVSLSISQYGRNWKVGCPITFEPCVDSTEFEQVKADRLAQLSYLKRVADDMKCETYLPELIEYISYATFDNYKEMLSVNLFPIFNISYKKLI